MITNICLLFANDDVLILAVMWLLKYLKVFELFTFRFGSVFLTCIFSEGLATEPPTR